MGFDTFSVDWGLSDLQLIRLTLHASGSPEVTATDSLNALAPMPSSTHRFCLGAIFFWGNARLQSSRETSDFMHVPVLGTKAKDQQNDLPKLAPK